MNVNFGANLLLTQSKAKPALLNGWLSPDKTMIESRSTKKKFEKYIEANALGRAFKLGKNQRLVLSGQDFVDFTNEFLIRAREQEIDILYGKYGFEEGDDIPYNQEHRPLIEEEMSKRVALRAQILKEFSEKAEKIDLDA